MQWNPRAIQPKETQQKIVDIIESLFAKLDIAQEKVEHVLAESENRRSAILHNAFSGKLTEKWREENNVSFDSWNEYKIKDIAKNIKDKYDPEKDKFLNPTLIEERLSAMDNPLDKLRFLYDYLYCNANKNRFALFRDSNFQESKLYCDNEGSFDRLNFLPAQRMPYS